MRQKAANQANVRAAIPSIETFAADNNGSATDADASALTSGYAGMTTARLLTIDAGLSPNIELGATAPTSTHYCLADEERGHDHVPVLLPAGRRHRPSTARSLRAPARKQD